MSVAFTQPRTGLLPRGRQCGRARAAAARSLPHGLPNASRSFGSHERRAEADVAVAARGQPVSATLGSFGWTSAHRRARAVQTRAGSDPTDEFLSEDELENSNAGTPESRMEKYNRTMKVYSKAPFEYRFDVGLYYHEIIPEIIVGTQPATREDVQALKDLGVTVVMNTQQDKDMDYWGINYAALKGFYEEVGIKVARHPFPDFDAEGLRRGLPEAASALDTYIRRGERVYLHCTAGMGRSPGVAIGYLYWFGPHDTLESAYEYLTSRRPCGPNKEALRKATADLLAASPGTGLPVPVLGDADIPEGAGVELGAEGREAIQSRLRQHAEEREAAGKLPVQTVVLGIIFIVLVGGIFIGGISFLAGLIFNR